MEFGIQKNSIWMVNLGNAGIVGHEQKGTRPFYVVSSTAYNKASNTPIGFFLSTSAKKQQNRFTVDVGMQGTLENVNVSQIRTLSADRFSKYMGMGTDEDCAKLMETFNQNIL